MGWYDRRCRRLLFGWRGRSSMSISYSCCKFTCPCDTSTVSATKPMGKRIRGKLPKAGLQLSDCSSSMRVRMDWNTDFPNSIGAPFRHHSGAGSWCGAYALFLANWPSLRIGIGSVSGSVPELQRSASPSGSRLPCRSACLKPVLHPCSSGHRRCAHSAHQGRSCWRHRSPPSQGLNMHLCPGMGPTCSTRSSIIR